MILLVVYFAPFLQLSSGQSCKKTDSRGVIWEGGGGEILVQACSFANFTLSGNASWHCGDGGNFNSQEPDRRDCVSPEISDVMNSVEFKDLVDVLDQMNR